MNIFVNSIVKKLFVKIFLAVSVFAALSVIFTVSDFKYSTAAVFCTGAAALLFTAFSVYQYLKKENAMIENAVTQIRKYISENEMVHIDCSKEGDIYRMFHEINSLVSIMNAHIDKEQESRYFLKDIISDISHQLKTPIAALNIYNGIIQEEADENSDIREFADLSEKELERIETLVQNLLKIAKLDAGTMIMEKNDENISEMMYEIENKFAYRFESENKKFELYGDENTVFFCDRNWIIEAVGNIVKNALDHTSSGDTISVEWKSFRSMLQIIIKDNGEGIHEEDLYHIFKRFYRSRFSTDSSGTGLGLPLAKAVIEAHGGTVEVESERGIGTVFKINFLNI